MQLKPSNLHTSMTKALALTACMTIGLTANAQEVEGEDQGFEKITVTAQKRVERLSEVPVAVSVINSGQINSAFSSSFESLQSLVPSVSFKKRYH